MLKLDYESEERRQNIANIIKMRRDIDSGRIDEGLRLKIKNFCKDHGLEEQLVRYKLINDDVFSINFAKSPKRQSFHQSLALKFIVDNICSNAQQLPSSGPNSIMVSNGIVVSEGSFRGTHQKAKTVDFEWQMDKYRFLALHKFTKQGGGSQDNQFKDVQLFMEECKRSYDSKNIFLSICDGPYYMMPFRGFNSRIEFLNSQYSSRISRALTINELEKFIIELGVNPKGNKSIVN